MALTFHCIFIEFFFNFCPVRTMNRETTTTIHRLQHEKTHSIGIISSPSSLFIQKSPVHMSNMSTVWVFILFVCFFVYFPLRGETFILAALLQSREVVLLPLWL